MEQAHVITLMLACGSAMCAAIAYLFKTVMGLNDKQADLQEKIGELRGNQQGIENLSAKVLEEVHNATKSVTHVDPR